MALLHSSQPAEIIPSRCETAQGETQVKAYSPKQLALFVARDDASFFLEPLVDSLLANGLTAAQIQDAVAASARRVLRACLCDADVKLGAGKLDVEAQRIATKLIDRLTVTNPDAVPSVFDRRGLPAAVAAAA
jgi:hypothetical protein